MKPLLTKAKRSECPKSNNNLQNRKWKVTFFSKSALKRISFRPPSIPNRWWETILGVYDDGQWRRAWRQFRCSVLRGASKVPRDIGICRFLPKLRFLAKFNIWLHNIQGSERPDFLSTHTHIHPKQDGRKRTNQNYHLAPQGGVKSAPRFWNLPIFA